MKSNRSTKSALLSSVISLLLCICMLIGTTFAWLTDTASTGVNTIESGTLDVELQMWVGPNDDDWVSAQGRTLDWVVGDGGEAVWEPGCTFTLPKLRVVNKGDLDAKFKLVINGTEPGTDDYDLRNVLEWTVEIGREGPYDYKGETDGRLFQEREWHLPAGDDSDEESASGTILISAKLPAYVTESGEEIQLPNEYQGKTVEGVSVTVLAAQDTGEYDDSGSSTYVGYDGYIWNGSERTDQPAEDFSRDEHVMESTMGIQGAMSRYFTGEYVDLTSSQIALLNHYQPYAQFTAYSETQISEIQVVSETDGTLYIGTMKVADVVNTRTRAAANGAMYNVNAGVNTIALDLNVAEDETIVLGGNGSTAKLYVAKGIPANDQDGNFTLLDGQSHAEVIAQTNGYADTLAVQVSVAGPSIIPVFDNVKQWMPESSLSGANTVKHDFAPFVYSNLQYFAGKHITRIDIPVKNVQAGQTPTFTVTVVKQADVRNKNTNMVFGEPQTLNFTQTIDSSTANTWVTALCDIYVGEDETLAFGATTDTINWGYTEHSSTQPTYGFYYKVGQAASSISGSASIYFDLYENQSFNVSTHLEALAQKEEQARQQAVIDQQYAQLAAILNGKQLSILGDSISTFTGVSNDASEGLEKNAVFYDPRGLTQADTYWQQILTQLNMNLCINNSWSGSYATQHQPNVNGHLDQTGAISSGMARADKLTKKDGTKPDYIIVFIGINDLNAGVSSTVFSAAYNQILDTINTTYPNAEVFCLNMPNRSGSNPVAYNNAISHAVDSHTTVHLVDLYNSNFSGATYASNSLGDNLHPNANGMDYLSNLIIDKMLVTLLPTT